MKLPVCCSDVSTNQRSSKALAVRDKQFLGCHMLHSRTSKPLSALGCTWLADCQTTSQTEAFTPAASDSGKGVSAYIASEYCRPLLLGTVTTLGCNGDTGPGVSECAGATHAAGGTVSSVQECLAHSLTDMRPAEDIPVFVMLPLDTVNADGVFKYAYIPWFAQALQVLALSGVHGVAVDVWWCAAERAPRQYNWTGYKQLFEMVRGVGLKLQVVLSFHACGGNVGDLAQVPLPAWVLQAGMSDPDIFFTDCPRESGLGQRNKEYLSIWADDCPVLPGGAGGSMRSPIQAYGEFMMAFRDAFHEQLGMLIEEVVVGSGPCGELRYPSYVEANGWRFPGVGEFQCYDRRALASLAAAAAAIGRPEWGYAGPHDSGGYNSSPADTGFFAPGGSWDTEYGNFFLNWYSSCLLQHGERLLQLANQVFGPYKTPPPPPQQQLPGHLAGARAVIKRLQDIIAGSNDGSGDSGSSTNLAAVAAAATVAAAAASTGVGDSNAASVAAAAVQARSLLEQVQQLQQQPAGGTPAVAGRISSSTASSGDDDGAGSSSSTALVSHISSSVPSAGSSTPPSISCSTSATCLTPQSSSQLLTQQQRELGRISVGSTGSSSMLSAAAHAGSAAASNSSVWEQLVSPRAQALATSILQQLQSSSSLSLMAANSPVSDVASSTAPPAVQAANAASSPDLIVPAVEPAASSSPHLAASSAAAYGAAVGMPTVSSLSSASEVRDAELINLLSVSQQRLAELSVGPSSSTSSSDLGGSSPDHAGYKQLQPDSSTRQLQWGSSSNVAVTAAAAGSRDVQAGLSPAAAARVAGVGAAFAAGGGTATDLGGADNSSSHNSSSTNALTGVSGGSPSPPAAMAIALQFSGGSSNSPPVAAAETAATTALEGGGPNLLHMFVEALSGLGIHLGHQQQQDRHLQQQPMQRRRQQQQQLILTLKIAGVHWWYNSTSHASELTAGYYNTDSRDGYGPILALCGKHGVNLTLTCVEMCDAQHPSYALCGPEGLLRQIRAMAAKANVSLSGENALPIFTPGGVDAVALDRVVSNVRACRASPLRSCSSWPGPAATSSSSAAGYYSGNGDGMYGAFVREPWQQHHHHHQQQQGCYVGNGPQYAGSGLSGFSRAYSSGLPGGHHHYQQQQYQQQQLQQQQYQQQQQPAYHLHHGAGMHTGTHTLAAGRNFSELGQLLSYEANRQAANSSSSSSLWHQQGPDSSPLSGCYAAANYYNDSSSSGGGGGGSLAGTDGAIGHAHKAGVSGSHDHLLPAMRAFTFLRLGPEILQPDVHASWMRFMHRMLNERA